MMGGEVSRQSAVAHLEGQRVSLANQLFDQFLINSESSAVRLRWSVAPRYPLLVCSSISILNLIVLEISLLDLTFTLLAMIMRLQ